MRFMRVFCIAANTPNIRFLFMPPKRRHYVFGLSVRASVRACVRACVRPCVRPSVRPESDLRDGWMESNDILDSDGE